MPSPGSTLRSYLAEPRCRVAVGSHDALTAKLAETAGFDLHYLTGYGTSAALAGLPDLGLLTMTEMVDTCRRICAAVRGPVIADVDTGYGNALSVIRTVQAFEAAGAAGIQLEDQSFPKRCGLLADKQLISPDEMANKIRAALDARRDPSLVVIARTDAIATEGPDGAIRRAQLYREAGADAVLVDAPATLADVERIAREVPGPGVFDWTQGGTTAAVSRQTLEDLGYRVAIFADTTAVIHRALGDFLRRLATADELDEVEDSYTPFAEFNEFVGLDAWLQQGARYEA